MELIERVEQLESELKALRPDLHFPSTATLEHRLRWLEIVLEETRARNCHGVYAETPSEEKLRQLLAHTVYIKQDRITLHSLTADPGSVVAGDVWFRSDLGKSKQAIDAVVANAKLLRREGDVIATAEVPSLDAAKITSGRFGVARMPDGTSGYFLKAQGAGTDPVYAAAAGVPSGVIAMWHGTIASIPSGWVICDGNNSTPNLLAKFVEGVATAATNPGTTGGATSKTTSGHIHYMQEGVGNQVNGAGYYGVNCYINEGYPAQETQLGDQLASGTDSITDIRPPFYDIAFIKKT